MTPSSHSLPVHARTFRALLRLYPPRFREAYGDEMTGFFLERLSRARSKGRVAVSRLWLRTVGDVLGTAWAERRQERRAIRTTRGSRMGSIVQDVRHAARRLARTPVFALSAVLILGLGIGLNAAVFNVVDTVLLRPPPFGDPERLVHIYQDSDEGEPSSTAYPAYRDIAGLTDVFEAVAATSPDGAIWEAVDGPRQVSIEFATADYMHVLGLQPMRGRWFGREHDVPGGEMVAVVTHRAWRTLFGSDPGIIGRTIRLNNQPVTIIGIGPAGFNGEAGALVTDFWLSISSTPVGGPYRVINLERREDHWYQVKARLADGVGIERARAALNALAAEMGAAYPDLDRGRDITLFAHDEIRFHPDVDAGILAASTGLLAVAGLVLLLACGNLANLLLVRGLSRAPEMAVRQALGAGRARIARLFLVEALLLAALGGVAGLGLAAWSVQLVPLLPLPTPGGGLDIGFDHRVVLFGIALALVTGLLFGLAPALRSARADVASTLRDEGRGRSASRGVTLLRGGLVVLQVAVSIVLVIGAGLLARSLENTQRVDSGVDVERIAILGTNLQQGGVTADEAAVVVAQLMDRVAALPGVERVALTTRLPVQSGGSTTQVVDGYEPSAGTGSVEVPFAFVSREYFDAMGIRLVEGRAFGPQDVPGAPTAIVVNETAARLYWGGNAIGGRIRSQGNVDGWNQVVGVVSDVKVSSLREPPTPMMYISAEQGGVSFFSLVVRTSGDPAALLPVLRSTLREVRPSLPVVRLTTLSDHLGDGLAGPRIAALLMGGFSLLALLLASLGVYAVVSFTVERRTQEMGIRLALGAARARLVGMVVGESLLVVGLGIIGGLWLAALAAKGLEGMLYGVRPADPVTFGGASVLLLLAAAFASFLPARRAAGADPVDVLRRQ